MNTHEKEDQNSLETLAHDYVLGLLDPQQHSDFDDTLALSARARELVAKTEDKINQLALLSVPKKAPTSTWDGIQARLNPASSKTKSTQEHLDAPTSSPSRDHQTKSGLRWLPWLMGTNALLALALTVSIIYPSMYSSTPTEDMPYAAIFQNASAEPLWYMRASEDKQALYVKNTKTLGSGSTESDQICFLWLQTADGHIPIAPVPMDGSDIKLSLSPEAQQWLSQDAKLFITREQKSENASSIPSEPSDILESSGRLVRDPTLI